MDDTGMFCRIWYQGLFFARGMTVSLFLALLLNQKVTSIEQRLREWCYDAQDKRGRKRQVLDVTTCFVPLLRWVISLWTDMALARVVDATSLGERFVVLRSVLSIGAQVFP